MARLFTKSMQSTFARFANIQYSTIQANNLHVSQGFVKCCVGRNERRGRATAQLQREALEERAGASGGINNNKFCSDPEPFTSSFCLLNLLSAALHWELGNSYF